MQEKYTFDTVKDMDTADPGITTVRIPEGVTEIDNFAFSDCHDFKELILPDSISALFVNLQSADFSFSTFLFQHLGKQADFGGRLNRNKYMKKCEKAIDNSHIR